MKAEYSSMRSLEEAMVRSCHTGTAVAAGGRGGAKGSYAGHRAQKNTSETQHKHDEHTYNLAFCSKSLPDMGGGTGPGRFV